jgi:hypothetical protein
MARTSIRLGVVFWSAALCVAAAGQQPTAADAKAERARRAWAEVEAAATAKRNKTQKADAERALSLARDELDRLTKQKAAKSKIQAAEANVARREETLANLPTAVVSPRMAPAMIGVGSFGKLFPDTALKVTKLVGPKAGYVVSAGDLYLVHTDFGKLAVGDFLKVRGIVECTGKHEVADLVTDRKRIVYEWWVYDN